MRTPSRAPAESVLARKEQWRRDRAAAQTVRSAFPLVERVSIELKFEDPSSAPPASQSHVMYPPARAFFEFPCPYAHCDGKIDLAAAVSLTMRETSSKVTGVLECPGVRSRTSQTKEPCGVRVQYAIAAEYRPEGGAKK